MNVWEVMPLNQLLMHATNCSNIYFNLSLFQYLDKHTIQNIGSKDTLDTLIHTYYEQFYSFEAS